MPKVDINQELKKSFGSDNLECIEIFTYRSYKLYGKDYFCDICLFKDKEKNKVFVRLQKRWFGLSKNMKKNGEKKPRWIVIKSYNFPQKFEFERVRKIFDQISKGQISAVDQIEGIAGADSAISEITRLKDRVRKLAKQKVKPKNDEQNKILREKVKTLKAEFASIRKDALKSQITNYRTIIKNIFADLETKGENFLQKVFEDNDWIFGPVYEEVIPKRKADPENQPDFVLKRYDGFSDVVEIEKPNVALFTKPDKSGKSQATAALIHAVTQAMDYIESHNQKFKDMFYDDIQKGVTNPLHSYYPRGFVIMGRDSNTDRKKLRQLNNFLHNIVVLTYDEFLRQSQRMLDILEK